MLGVIYQRAKCPVQPVLQLLYSYLYTNSFQRVRVVFVEPCSSSSSCSITRDFIFICDYYINPFIAIFMNVVSTYKALCSMRMQWKHCLWFLLLLCRCSQFSILLDNFFVFHAGLCSVNGVMKICGGVLVRFYT